MAETMDATGVVDPGPAYNFDGGSGLALLMRCKELLKSGDFRVKQSSDGITINTSGDLLTNTTVTDTNGFLNDGTLGFERVAGSLGNCGAVFVIAPKASYTAQFEMCFEVVSGSSGDPRVRVQVACGGFANILVAGRAPEPLTAGDALTRLGSGTNAAPVGVAGFLVGARLDATVTSGATQPYFDVSLHDRGTSTLRFTFVADYLQTATLSGAGTVDPYPWVVGAFAGTVDWRGSTMGTLAGAEASGGQGFVTRFGTNLSTIVTAHPLYMPDGGGNSSHTDSLGKDTQTQEEAALPLFYARSTKLGIARGAGFKGVSGHLKWVAEPHVFGEHGNQASATARETYTVGDCRFRWGKPSVECLR